VVICGRGGVETKFEEKIYYYDIMIIIYEDK